MSTLGEFQIIQNDVIGAHAIWQFSLYYHEYNTKNEYPYLILCLPVLPIVFNLRARDEINNRNFKEGSLFRTINENRDIYVGLQERMESMAPLTLRSINNAVSFKVLEFDQKSTRLIPLKNTFPKADLNINEDYDKVIQSAKRIGAWFGQLELFQITTYFNIRF